ncbi:MAG: DUF115 domain-containing protein [bacterium]|nr:DUF115 domain-containing protein [bacterium]MDY4099816.1 6-hydroxymethylpterin diphosphokinase MptE-like protein [Lachnospiraceae bacterium]
MNPEIYKKNMDALRKRFPGVVEVIEKKMYEGAGKVHVSVEYAQDESPILLVEKDQRQLYLSGKREPRQTAARVIERWGKLNHATPIYVVGMGNVAFMTELLEQTDPGINIMVYEPSIDIFLTLLQEADISVYFKNRALGLVVNGLNEEEMDGIIQAFINLANVGFLKHYVCPNYREFFPEEVLHFLKRLEKLSSNIIVGRNTGIRFSTVEADNLFHNIGYMCDNYITTQLCDVLPTDIPAIVVSAGPSLNKNIHELKKAKNKAFIVAVDTAVKPLVRAGIIPDMYVIVDGLKPEELLDFEEAKSIPMMPSVTSAKAVLSNHHGKKIFYFEGQMFLWNLFAMNGIPFSNVACGGSVACSAFSVVYKLGFSRIILVGQDLAMTGNKTHADGTFKEKMDEIDTSHCMMVEGNCEEKVPTRGDFKLYLDWFNYYIAGCEGIHVMNATEGGAKIENTEIITLREAIERECHKEVDMKACFDKLQPVFNEECRERAVSYLRTIPDMFRGIKKDVKKGQALYKKLQKICKTAHVDQTAYLQVLNKIKKLTNKIEGHELFSIITATLAVVDYLISSEQFHEEDSLQKEGLEIARQGITYMGLVEQCIDLLIPLAEETVGQLK